MNHKPQTMHHEPQTSVVMQAKEEFRGRGNKQIAFHLWNGGKPWR